MPQLESEWHQEPLVIAFGADDGDALSVALDAVTSVAGIISTGDKGTEKLVLDDEGARLEPYGLALTPLLADVEQLDKVDRLLTHATVRSEPEPVTSLTPLVVAPGDVAGVTVKLLCHSPTITGVLQSADLHNDRVLEVLAYLVLHQHRASASQLTRALYPIGEFGRSRRIIEGDVAQVSATLQLSTNGRSRIRVDGDDYLLDDSVTSDWSHVRALVASSTLARPNQAIVCLRRALELVNGMPESDNTYRWLMTEGLSEAMRAEVVDAAHHLACLALAASDTELVRWAVARGRRVEPISDLLARDAMAACECDGDLAGVESIWHELETSLELLASAEPSPETRALHAALVSGKRPMNKP